MGVNQSVLQNYQKQQILTASPAKLVALLYDRAVTSLNDAVKAIERGDIQTRATANKNAISVIGELWGALDLERGGEVAQNLNRLYSFMITKLSEVDMKNNAQAARDVITLLDPLRKSWHQLASQGPETAAPSQGAPEQPAARPDAPAPSQVTLTA
jgi:flagellar protein FliS